MNQTLQDLAAEARDCAQFDDFDAGRYELHLEFHQDDSRRCPECGMIGGHRQGCPEAYGAPPMCEEDHPDFEVES